ncbi:MAG: HAMP domain-containing histidine kinase [Chromatiales bacterium]|nr:HAMP domain-containing histidine kinase [Chromatiales bacterium]
MKSTQYPATILVVDDHDLNRRLVTAVLGKRGFQVLEAEHGEQALAIVDSQHVDLVLLDIEMPVLNGVQTLLKLREIYSIIDLPVVMFTANDEEERVVELLSLGANDYVVKPFKPDIATARIRTQLSISALSRLKDDVVRFASHDLKKPMMLMADIIDSSRDLDLASPQGCDALRDHLNMLDRTNQRMAEVVHGFLDQTRRQAGETMSPGKVDINTLIDEVCESNQEYADKKQSSVQALTSPALPTLSLDRFKIRQVLENLIGNALKFCPHGSRVEVHSLCRDNRILVQVVDNGPGLSQDDLGKLFLRGVRLSNRPTGGESSSGLGLPLCKELVEFCGGRIGARNNPQGGATFWLDFPSPCGQSLGDCKQA